MFDKSGYEEFNALNDVSFEVKKGEFFGILGRNGSGKSTLLKVLAGIYTADKGKVHIDGLISPFLELGIGFNPELSGRDNIYLNATVLGLTEKQIDEKFDDIVAFSELERFIDQKVKNYSSGMQVRLAFSVAIHANREILLMDEVLAVGDSNFQSKCLTEFNRYKEMGKTVILVSHDVATIQRYCDRAMLLRNGKIVKIGDAEEVGNEYINQNMSDEEKRILEEEKRKKSEEEKRVKEEEIRLQKASEEEKKKVEEERKKIEEEKKKQEEIEKNKPAKITKVEFFDKDGVAKNVFETGEDISVRVYFKKNTDLQLNFGLALFNEENNYISGINTFSDRIETEKYMKNNFFQINYLRIPLRTGTYFVKAGIWGETDRVNIDFINKSEYFKIVSRDKNQGMVNIDYKWD